MFTIICLYIGLIFIQLTLWDRITTKIYEHDRDWLFEIIKGDPRYNTFATEIHMLNLKHYAYRYFKLSPWQIYSFDLRQIIMRNL